MPRQKLAPLFSNGDLETLANGVLRLTKDRKFAVYERLVAVRGVYERERATLHARIAALEAELAAPQWEPVAQSLEYDLITHAIKHGEIPQGYCIYRSKEPSP